MNRWNLDQVYRRFVKQKSEIPDVLANQSVRFFKDSFKKQGFDDGGIKTWKKSKRVELGGGSTLVKSGRLRRSIKVKTANFDKIVVSTFGIDYAKVHNEGNKKIVSVSSYLRNGKQVKAYSYKANTPQRKFMGVSKTLLKIHEKTIDKAIKDCFK